MVSSKAEEEGPYGISKASPFGRGVTEGDGEGKPVTKRLLTQRWAGSLSERCYRNVAASLSASLPSQALRASSPKGRALGISVKFPLDEQSLSVSWTVVPCCPGQRQLDKVRCPEAAALCNKARPFAPYCASGVQLRAARPAKGSPRQGSCLRSRLRGFSHTKKRQTRICLFFHALIALLSPAFSA